jgi:hypothetical protein
MRLDLSTETVIGVHLYKHSNNFDTYEAYATEQLKKQ